MNPVRGLEPGVKAALIVNEVQNGIVDPAYDDTTLAREAVDRRIVSRINDLAAAFRAVGAPVVFCTIAALNADWTGFRVNCSLAARLRRDGRLVTGTEHAALAKELVVEPSDILNHRTHGMAPFTGTSLDATLRAYDIETVVLTGVSSNIALQGASTEAVALGYNVVLAEDCTAGGTAATHQVQIAMHLPLLATISDSGSIVESLSAAGSGAH
jgi:nicotinamidase-related amidase